MEERKKYENRLITLYKKIFDNTPIDNRKLFAYLNYIQWPKYADLPIPPNGIPLRISEFSDSTESKIDDYILRNQTDPSINLDLQEFHNYLSQHPQCQQSIKEFLKENKIYSFLNKENDFVKSLVNKITQDETSKITPDVVNYYRTDLIKDIIDCLSTFENTILEEIKNENYNNGSTRLNTYLIDQIKNRFLNTGMITPEEFKIHEQHIKNISNDIIQDIKKNPNDHLIFTIKQIIESILTNSGLSLDQAILSQYQIDITKKLFDYLTVTNHKTLKEALDTKPLSQVVVSQLVNYKNAGIITQDEFTHQVKTLKLGNQIANGVSTALKTKGNIYLNFNQDAYSKTRLENYTQQYHEISNNNSIPNITLEQIEEYEDDLIKKIIGTDLTYLKAASSFKIIIDKETKTFRVGNDIYPLFILQDMLTMEKTNLENAFHNINMFLTNNETVFQDEFYREYILNLDDTHILGIKRTELFLQDLVRDHDEIKNIISNINITQVPKPNPTNPIKNILLGPGFTMKTQRLLIQTHLSGIDEQTPTTKRKINKEILAINNAQRVISEIFTDQREEKRIERLVYFLKQKNYNFSENVDFTDNKKDSTKSIITKTIEENIAFLGNDFLNSYLTDEPFYDRITQSINGIPESQRTEIANYYSEIMSYQSFLDYKYKDVSRAIILHIPSSEWETYFQGKHSLNNGKNNKKSIGPFGIAQLLLEEEIKDYENCINEGKDIENTRFNLFKVFDKTYYIINYNYVTDIKRIFIVTYSENTKEYHIICEMDAFNETLMAYFAELNKKGIAQFYSVQNTENILIKSYKNSVFEELIDFKGNEYATILVFDEKGKDQRITQHYSSAKNSISSIEDFITKLNDGSIRLRTATSLNVSGNYEQDEKKYYSDLFRSLSIKEKVLSKKSMNELGLIGCSNAVKIIESMTYEETKKFLGIDDITVKEATYIKCILQRKNFETLLETLQEKLNYLQYNRRLLNLPQHPIAVSHDTYLTERVEETDKRISELTKLIEKINGILVINTELINGITKEGTTISLETPTDIRCYFEQNKERFTANNYVELEYLSECALSHGDLNLSIEIKKHCLKLFIEDKKEFLEKEYEKHYTIYLYQTGAKRGQTAVPEVVDANNKKISVEIFDREMRPLKQGCLESLSLKIDSIFPDAGDDDKIRYLEMADKELSSIIQVSNSKTSQTAFELEHDTEVKQNNARLRNLIESKRNELKKEIQEIVNDPSLKEVDKPTAISLKIHGFITMIKSLSSQFVFDAKELIDKYHFEEDRETIKAHHESKTRNYFAETYEDNCSVESLIEVVIDTFKNEVESLKYKYELHGGYYFEQDLGDIETVLKISEKRTEFIKKLNQKSSVYRVSIWQIYESLVANNAALSINKKEDLREYIILRMAQTIREIEGKTGSKLFSQGLAEFNKDSFNPNMAEDIPRETLEQIRRSWH